MLPLLRLRLLLLLLLLVPLRILQLDLTVLEDRESYEYGNSVSGCRNSDSDCRSEPAWS